MEHIETRHWEALESQLETVRHLSEPRVQYALKQAWFGPKNIHSPLQIADKTEESFRTMMGMIRSSLSHAEPYYWGERICEIISAAAPSMPTWTFTRTSLLSPHGWFYFVKPFTIPYVYPDHVEPPAPLGAVSWLGLSGTGLPEEKGFKYQIVKTPDQITDLLVTYFLKMGSYFFPITSTTIHEGDDLNAVDQLYMDSLKSRNDFNEISHQIHLWKVRHFAACLSFLEQRILSTERRGLPRPVRRRLDLKIEPQIQTIYLRRINPSKPEGESEPIEWSHRWVVRGHWRQQWYRKQHIHKPKWIHPFIKGPEDKPLKSPDKLFKVVR